MTHTDWAEENFTYKHAKSSWITAYEHLSIVETLAKRGIEEGSLDSLMQAENDLDYRDRFSESGIANNFLACVPLLFLLLRAIELYIKAFEYVAYPSSVPKKPYKLRDLVALYSAAPYRKIPADEAFIRKYTSDDGVPNLVSRFLKASGKSMDDLLTMRLHISKAGLDRTLSDFTSLSFDESEGRDFFRELKEDIAPLLSSCNALQSDIDAEGIPGSLVEGFAVEPYQKRVPA